MVIPVYCTSAVLVCAVLGGFSVMGLLSPFLSSSAQLSVFEVVSVMIGAALATREITLSPDT